MQKKLCNFGKEEGASFSPDIFLKALRECSMACTSESYFGERDHITPSFKVKIVKDEEVVLRRKKIINGLISEIKLNIHN